MSGNSLINLGELSKPATVLLEKIAEAVGGVFQPYQMRRLARAEADAELIRTQSGIEISDLQRRAVQRWLAEEANKQDNIETITSKALPDITDAAEPERLEADWITNFFDKARLISNEEMQAFWAKVLAGEANDPGTYSKRTVNYLASLDAVDAEWFTLLCGFCWEVGTPHPIVFNLDEAVYAEAGLTFDLLRHLDDIGLIRFESQNALNLVFSERRTNVAYFGEQIHVRFPAQQENLLGIGQVMLSKVGSELAPLCAATPVEGFLEYVVTAWMEDGIIPSSRLPLRRVGRIGDV